MLPKVSRNMPWEKLDEDMLAHLEACGLDEAWDSDNAPSDTEPDLYPDAKTPEEIVAEVVPHAEYRALVPGLQRNTDAGHVTSNHIAIWGRAVRKNHREHARS